MALRLCSAFLKFNIIQTMMKSFLCSVVLFASLALTEQFVASKCSQLSYLPLPKKLTCDIRNTQVYKLDNPCNILYKIKDGDSQSKYKHFIELIQHQQYKTFGCHLAHIIIGNLGNFQTKGFKYVVEIQVTDSTLKSVFTVKQESYSANIDKDKATLKSATYVGFVRALQTFMQTITCNKYRIANCRMKHLPISIQDEPELPYRAIMIDSSRHYLPIKQVYETIDALMYNKMSVLHWHIVDEDSFPLKLDSHPQIAQYSAFSPQQIYTTSQVKDVIRYAMVRGVRVIPELDTPGHAASWGRAPQNKQLACTFGNQGYMGPLDVTLDRTYKLVKEVFTQIFQLFPDPYVHLGGDQVVLTCLTNKTEFMAAHKINQGQIQLQYRKLQRKILKEVNGTKKFVYWMNAQINLEEGDVVHWWGGGMPPTNLQVIISQYGPFYIDMGFGNYFGVAYGSYVTWLDIYNLDIERMLASYSNKNNVIGAQLTLWSELSNQFTHHQKIWIRSSSLAERTWSYANSPPKPDFFRRITAHERLMHRRGIPTAPATCQQCQTNPQFC